MIDTHEAALKRAVFWLSALIAEAEIEPAETQVTLTVGPAKAQIVQTLNLADDLKAFAVLGARSDMFDVDGAP